MENFVVKTILNPTKDVQKGVVDVKKILRNAKNSVCFITSMKVQESNEICTFYEIGQYGESDT